MPLKRAHCGRRVARGIETDRDDLEAVVTQRVACGTNCLIEMDGRGRALDNIFIERLWRTVKYEDIYIKEYENVPALEGGLGDYFHFYNYQRLHQSLQYCTPAEVHFDC